MTYWHDSITREEAEMLIGIMDRHGMRTPLFPYMAAVVDVAQAGKAEGERQTVEKIVAWLRAFDAPDDFYSLSFARSIEAGEWK